MNHVYYVYEDGMSRQKFYTQPYDETDEAPESTQEEGNNSWEEDTSSGETEDGEEDD